MAKRKTMGAAAKTIFPSRTGRQALADVAHPQAVPHAPRGAFDVTTVRLRRDQVAWLRGEAAQRANTNGGKPDASEVIRELIDGRMGP